MENIFKFMRIGENKYAGTCGHVTLAVTRSPAKPGRWRWDMKAAANDGYPAVSRSGSLSADTAEKAQRAALESAFSNLDELLETGIEDGYALDPDEGGAFQAAYELLDGAGCETA